LIIFE